MKTMETPRLRSTPPAGVTVSVEHEAKIVQLYVPRRHRTTTDDEFAATIEQMSRARREWQDRGYRVQFIR